MNYTQTAKILGVINLSKLRVYQLAKDLGVSSKDLIDKLKDLSVEVTNHMSTLEDEEASLLLELFSDTKKTETTTNNEVSGISKEDEDDLLEIEAARFQENIKISKKNKKKKQPGAGVEYREEVINSPKIGKTTIFGDKVVVKDLAEYIGKSAGEIISKLIKLGVMAAMNQEIDFETAKIVASEYEIELQQKIEEEVAIEDLSDLTIQPDEEKDLKPRPPVVTVMGHVDHGKTSLLDSIRKTKVTEREAGGITQHIGASEVQVNGKKVVFLDTPGHEAFTSMRARGAKVTDIAILVVAADDGVMPQTIEAINHVKAAKVPIIVAINKIDKPGANPDRVKQELSEHGVVIEAWGGDVIAVEVSALKDMGIDELLEMVLLVAEVEDLKANPNRSAIGTVVEAQLDKGKGPVATVLVQNGTLRIQDSVIIGTTLGRVRAMINDKGKSVKSAGPSTAVEITGLADVPAAGDQMIVVTDDKVARSIVEKRVNKIKEQQLKSSQKVSLDALFSQMQKGEIKELNIIFKADVQGSVEAVKASLNKLSNDKVVVKTIHGGVGAITESDVMLASASNAIIIGFNVRPTISATNEAKKEDVDVRNYRIIYKAIEDIEAAMKGMLDPEFKEVELGKAQVRATFKIPGGLIAGCYVIDGKIQRNAKLRLVRDGIVIHEGTIDSLRRFKDDAKEVATGYECGIGIDSFNDVKEGDIIEAYKMQEIERK